MKQYSDIYQCFFCGGRAPSPFLGIERHVACESCHDAITEMNMTYEQVREYVTRIRTARFIARKLEA